MRFRWLPIERISIFSKSCPFSAISLPTNQRDKFTQKCKNQGFSLATTQRDFYFQKSLAQTTKKFPTKYQRTCRVLAVLAAYLLRRKFFLKILPFLGRFAGYHLEGDFFDVLRLLFCKKVSNEYQKGTQNFPKKSATNSRRENLRVVSLPTPDFNEKMSVVK